MRFNSLDSGMLLNPMSTPPASAFTSSPLASTSNSNTYLPIACPSATAMATQFPHYPRSYPWLPRKMRRTWRRSKDRWCRNGNTRAR
ncbi:hypothetical protein CVT25_006117 [Psilocybe cyanescens]|uniref:Uncharacterized protein n=1 Tax=Psilocybe cyanescens TaxID=93625 RepID=A0A409X732_PSICY|nr:hypothetical protein CVT25_006117 [Psilocybe cyanescens]